MVEREETVTREKTRGAEVLAGAAAREEVTEAKEGPSGSGQQHTEKECS